MDDTLADEFKQLKDLALQVLDHLQKHAGSALYLEKYNQVHLHVLKKRQERRNFKSIQVSFILYKRFFKNMIKNRQCMILKRELKGKFKNMK